MAHDRIRLERIGLELVVDEPCPEPAGFV